MDSSELLSNFEINPSDLPFQEQADEVEVDEVGDQEDTEVNAMTVAELEPVPTEEHSLVNTFDEQLFVQLGDIIQIIFNGRQLIGKVYYRDYDQLHVKSIHDSNVLHIFEYKNNEEAEEFKDEYGVTSVAIVEKRVEESFVEQNHFEAGKKIITFTRKDTSETTYTDEYKNYTIVDVNSEDDHMTIEDDEKQRETIEFNFMGIPLDMPFVMIADQVKEATPVVGNEVEPEEAEAEVKEAEAEAEAEDPEDIVEYLGSFEITLGEEYREAAAFEQNIPDSIQKIDAFNDFIMQLPLKDQNNPKEIRKIRILVETLFYLKQAIVEYKDGSYHRLKKISVDTFVELIESAPVPLGRPILSINKKLYMNDDEDNIVNPDITSMFFLNELNDMISHSESYGEVTTKLVQESIQEWTNQKQFLTMYLSPWNAKEGTPLWNAIVDSDFFRVAIPEIEEGIFEKKIPGYLPSHSEKNPPLLDLLPFGVERALSTTFRKGMKRRKEALIQQENAPVLSYLVFPLKVAPHLGMIRCNHLAIDSGSSQFLHKTMNAIITELGSPMEGGSSNNIQLFNPSGETIGNIELSDYLNGIEILSLNIHDTFYVLQQYGLTDIELSQKIYNVLAVKIKENQNKFKAAMDKLRQEVTTVKPAPNKFIDPSFMDDLLTQEIIKAEIEKYEQFNPSLIESDIGLISYLIKHFSNYIQVTAGKKPLYIAKAKSDVERVRYLQEQINLRLIALNQPYDRPRPNPCKHVGMLVTIRRKYDDTERFNDLTQFFKKYQGMRNDNWIDCNVCNEHLLCIHERLQIQGYLNSAEKVSIDKEIILKFAGGQFQGRYICRNCGQPIKEFEFDSTVEFDEEGRPKSGNAVLVDDLEKKVDELLDPTALKTNVTLLLTVETSVYYMIIRRLCQFIEVSLKTEQIQHILDNILKYMKATVPSQQTYTEKSKKNVEEAKQKGLSQKKMIDYQTYKSKIIIAISTAYVLLEVQCTVPPILKRYRIKQKEYGLLGFPLDTDPTNVETTELFAIALSSCFKNEDPWNKTELLDVSEEKRVSTLKKNLQSIFNSILKNEVIQSDLHKRRFYKGPDLEDREVLPLSFLPEQIKSISPEQLDGSTIIIPEVAANNAKSRLALIQFWILNAHQVAQTSAELHRGSGFAETTCCRKNIITPSAVWESEEFQKINIGLRSLMPKHIKTLLTIFVPRPQNTELIAADESLYYRLFLKCCFTGPRIGYSHEPGLTYKCPWCEFQFPGNPRVMDTDTEGKAELEKSEVKIDDIEFKKLLNAIHTLHIVPSVRQQRVSNVFNELDDFQEDSKEDVEPCMQWNTLIVDTLKKLKTLGPAADELSQVSALEELAEISNDYIINVKANLPKDSRGNPVKSKSTRTYEAILDSIVDLPWMQFFDVLQMYFMIPLQRILSEFTDTMLYSTIEMTESLSEEHIDSAINPILKKELSFYSQFDVDVAIEDDIRSKLDPRATVSEDVFAQEKDRIHAQITSCVQNLSCMIEYKHKLRFRNLSEESRDELFKYCKKLILYGALDLLFEGTNKVLVDIVLFHLNKFHAEKLSFSPLEIKSRIEFINEKERTSVIDEFDVLSEEVKAIEQMKKRLGIGKWAIGGTKVIYAYDKDYYDLERERRLDAGIIDFPGLDMDYMPSPVDDLGFGDLNDADIEQGGYDNNQHADDDYE